MGYKLKYSHQADKDARLLEQEGLDKVAIKLLATIQDNPYKIPPVFEKLKGNLKGLYSRKINKQHRLIYEILPNTEDLKDKNGDTYQGIVKILRMWTHYE